MARINRRPSANRRSVIPAETAESFVPALNDPFDPSAPGFGARMEDPDFRAKLEEHFMSMSPKTSTPEPVEERPGLATGKSKGIVGLDGLTRTMAEIEHLRSTKAAREKELGPRSPDEKSGLLSPFTGTAAERFGSGVPSTGPDTGIAKIMALSKPGALRPTVIPAGAAGVKTPGMRFGPSVGPGGTLGGFG